MFSKLVAAFKIPDIRNKMLVIAFLLIVFRLFAAIPIPGIDAVRLREFLGSNQLLGFLNVFSGGTLSNLSVMMLGVGPYITATIIMQLLTMIFPNLKQLYYEEGAIGRAKFNRISRYITVPLAGLQAYGFLNLLNSQGVLPALGLFGTIRDVAIITAGSMILVWIGELITEKKIGNGTSLIIFAGIVSALPQAVRTAVLSYDPAMLPTYIAFAVLAVIIIAGVVYVNQGERKIPVAYSKRVRGNKVYGGAMSYLPLRVNQAGVIPIIFAISILLFPQFFAQILSIVSTDLSVRLNDLVARFLNNQFIYGVGYFVLVVVFTYFYTAVTFDPKEIAKNLQRSGGFIPGIRPGEPSGDFLGKLVNRVTLFGAIFLGIIAILPLITRAITGIATLTIGGTALLIVVSVALETMQQLEAQLVMREYEGME
ncbi:MAG: preprotein translocase subunit SecY [Candidatus Harrisonbacteria bacterium]|nr:preprotein translocase subunit SecY [Candidatus Harrisonbacteria bacterium]MBI2406103.1 preprotein translocase subunit SecY [Candidatus Harrisonbacteria bacterium]MBI3114606.1 preprotein translocase subunit SecY [Candidatus Harrisonbacteria bacterium]